MNKLVFSILGQKIYLIAHPWSMLNSFNLFHC